MPQGKRKYSRCDPKVLGSKDLKKIQKLVHHLSDEEDECKKPKPSEHVSKYSLTDIPCETSSTNPEHDPEDVDELTQEWKNFYKPGAADDDDYLIKYQSNLKSCHSEVSEAMSQFAGSLPGDLEAFDESADLEDLPVEIQDHLRLLTDVLKHYRSGPLPKTVKMLPHLPGWANILKILNPLQWTVHAYQRVVKVFASKGGEQALVFYEQCILPMVRENISENRRLDVHLFETLIASMFRPEEFIAGIFFPWVKSDISKMEGIILANLMKRASLKARYASVGLALILEEEFSIPRSLVIESILNKKYHLPEGAISCLIKYFLRFDSDASNRHFITEGYMPVTWFRSLLVFIDLYREAIRPDERDLLLRLCRRHQHPQITSEIRVLLGLLPPGRMT